MKKLLLSFLALLFLLPGCAMFTAWKSIPAPGGCDQCHTVAISTNWQVAYQPVILSDASGRPHFQKHEYYQAERDKAATPLEAKKISEMKCFDCHKSPTPAHRERMGKYHH